MKRINLYPHRYIALAMMVIVFFGCRKDDSLQLYLQTKSAEFSVNHSANLTAWLESKKADFYSDSNIINRILSLADEKRSYTESYDKESFLIIPLNTAGAQKASTKIRSDLNSSLEFLLVVKDISGNMRRADIAVFYPKSDDVTALPSGFFQTFFEEQRLTVDGTFSLIGLKDQNIFEMTYDNGKPTKFKDWQARNAPAVNTPQVCIDWYLVTTTYWSDGTYTVDEMFLYTQCYGGDGGGGGGGGTQPPAQEQPTLITKPVTVTDGRREANGYMNFTCTASFTLTGLKYSNPNSNCFTSSTNEGTLTTWPPGMHLPGTAWEITVSGASQAVSLQNNSKEAYCFFSITINFPSGNTNGPIVAGGPGKRFYASTFL